MVLDARKPVKPFVDVNRKNEGGRWQMADGKCQICFYTNKLLCVMEL